MYLLYRHPLRGGKVHDMTDELRDENLTWERKLYLLNILQTIQIVSSYLKQKQSQLPWHDTSKISYKITGPYLSTLFLQAFTAGLHDPSLRPSANDWENALIKTMDLIQPCNNPKCDQKWYIFDNTIAPKCPFCDTPYKGKLPVLNLYSSRKEGKCTG